MVRVLCSINIYSDSGPWSFKSYPPNDSHQCQRLGERADSDNFLLDWTKVNVGSKMMTFHQQSMLSHNNKTLSWAILFTLVSRGDPG